MRNPSEERHANLNNLYSERVELNIGGLHYTTTVGTLMKDSDSLLYKEASTFNSDSDKNLFFDRDGRLFPYILNFLRDGDMSVLPESSHDRKCLMQEAKYFNIVRLVHCLLQLSVDFCACITVRYNSFLEHPSDHRERAYVREPSVIHVFGDEQICRHVFGRIIMEIDMGNRKKFVIDLVRFENVCRLLIENGFKLASGNVTRENFNEQHEGQIPHTNHNNYTEYIFTRQ